jgi:hypothetical protein
MEEMEPKLTAGDIFGYALAYLCWFCTAAIGMLAVFHTRDMINVIWPVLGGNRWVLRAVDRFALLFIGLIWLVYVIFIEQYYRSSITVVRDRRFKARIAPSARPIPPPQGRMMKMLWKLGLDVLASRFVPTFFFPLLWFVISYLLQQLGFALTFG